MGVVMGAIGLVMVLQLYLRKAMKRLYVGESWE